MNLLNVHKQKNKKPFREMFEQCPLDMCNTMVNRKYQHAPHHGEIRLRALKNHRLNFVSRAKRIQFRDSV